MQYKILWLTEAIDNLTKIKQRLEEYSSESAIKTVTGIYNSVSRLEEMPWMFPEYRKISALRRMVVGDYSVFYRVFDDKKLVEIDYIRHHYEDASNLI